MNNELKDIDSIHYDRAKELAEHVWVRYNNGEPLEELHPQIQRALWWCVAAGYGEGVAEARKAGGDQ